MEGGGGGLINYVNDMHRNWNRIASNYELNIFKGIGFE